MQSPVYGQPVPQQPMQPVPPKRFNGKIIGGLIVIILGLLLAAVAFISPWWSVSGSITGFGQNVTLDERFSLTQYCTTQVSPLGSLDVCASYTADMKPIADTFMLGMILLLLGLLMTILTIVFIAIAAAKPKLKGAVLAVGLIGALMILFSALYVFTALPSAMNSSTTTTTGATTVSGFFGTISMSFMGATINLVYGGALGWFMAIIAFLMVMIGTMIAFAGIKKPAPVVQAPPPPPPPMV